MNKKILLLFLHCLVFTFISCGNNIPYTEETILKRPVGLKLEAKTGLSFDIIYFVQNEEETFDGYNLYISRKPISDSERSSLPPLNLKGSLPTFHHTAQDVNLTTPVVENIHLYSDNITKFEEGVTYYFRMAAHSKYGYLSELSNEISEIAIK
ncbi:MAG: hypothetical protein OEZ22_09515 [Spirochaetia bacterium]|nr:hypothetical protein [Spirochaetia bacterium]